jgi:RNA polymerase sigma-70 factor (ECF subfamily)
MTASAACIEGPWPLDARVRLLFTLGSERLENARKSDDPLEQRAIEAVQRGDRNAYDFVVTRHMRRVVSIAWSIVRNPQDAEDLAQDAFVKAYQHIGRFRAAEPFGPYINRIVTNLALDLLKHRRRVQHSELSETEPAARRDLADLPALSNEIASRIDAALESLPEMQRIVARLSLVEDLDSGEIAAMMNLSEGTVRSHLSLARRKLREQLGDLYEAGK